MGRARGQLVRCTCTSCGAVELANGCTVGYQCHECQPVRYQDDPQCAAHRAVAKAIAAGALKPIGEHDCADCGVKAEHYDHRDYSKPLEVEPVCRRCNYRRGSATTA